MANGLKISLIRSLCHCRLVMQGLTPLPHERLRSLRVLKFESVLIEGPEHGQYVLSVKSVIGNAMEEVLVF